MVFDQQIQPLASKKLATQPQELQSQIESIEPTVKSNRANFFSLTFLQDSFKSQSWERLLGFKSLSSLNIPEDEEPETRSQIIAATLMFVDIKDFTSFAAKHSPSQVVEQLNSLFAIITPIIQKYNGTIDKYMGDEVMAYFRCQAPWQYTQTALSAVNAAKAIQRAVAKLNAQWLQRGWSKLECGIGLHTGPVIYAPVGFQEKSEMTVIGDTVNLAARLQKMTRRFEVPILMSERTHQLIASDNTPSRDLGFHTIRGQKQRVKIFTLT